MIHMTGNLFDSTAPAIGHGINCTGLMGAGIAVQFRERHPDMHTKYVEMCDQGQIVPGAVFAWVTEDRVIYNIASQDFPGANARMEWLAYGVYAALEDTQRRGFDRLALPQIGCGIGGLKVDDVVQHLESIEGGFTTEIEWWTYA